MVLALVGAFLLYRATQHVPEFYQQALRAEPVAQKQASDEMLQKTTDLAKNVKKKGHWEAIFTDAQINGWLAVDLQASHSNTLPPEIRDPRVVIEPGQVQLGFRFVRGDWNTVVSLAVEPTMPEPNLLALRIRRVRAGSVPLPLNRLLDEISKAVSRTDIRLEWRQADGDPVALLSLPSPRDTNGKQVRIEAVRLGRGEIYVSGTTTGR